MHVLPLQFIFILRLALISLVTYSKDTETIQVIGNVEHSTNHGICRCPVIKSTTTHLNPTGAQSQFFCLILHGDGGNRSILYPTVILHGITQHDNRHWGPFKKLTAHILGIGEFLEIQFIIDHYELPGSLPL